MAELAQRPACRIDGGDRRRSPLHGHRRRFRVEPARGLYAAVIGGFLVSALGGSRYQIGGPAGAFIVLVAATVGKFGVSGLILTVFLSGLMLVVAGFLRLGSLIRHIPHAVTVGFTCGIAVTIFASQLKDLAGLALAGPEPGALLPKLAVLAGALPSWNPPAFALGAAVTACIFAIKRIWPDLPGMLIAVIGASLLAYALGLPVDTIGTRFGDLPHGLQVPRLPPLHAAMFWQVLPSALSFTLLGGIESLLSAKVADSMTNRRHRSNMELVAQGIANIGSALFGGISVTGTIARTATNVRAGAKSPLAGMFHSTFLLIFMLVAASLARFVPLTALAGILAYVCWNMAEKAEFGRLMGSWREAAVLLPTFILTVIVDLTTGIVAGCVVAGLLALLHRSVSQEDA